MLQPSNEPERTPRSAAEIRTWIISEVARFLQVDASEIDPAASIHKLGVDSLAALSMTGSLAAWLGKDVSATLLWDHDSINAIANSLGDAARASVDPPPQGVITLQPHGELTPLFFFPGLGGHPVTFTDLAHRLGDAQPCYGLTVPGLSADHEPMTRVEDIAAAMVQTIRHLQPAGPYQLAGYSFGGLLAYEAARQLTSAGQTVSTLAIFDVYTTSGRKRRPAWQALGVHLYLLLTRPSWWKHLASRIAARYQKISKAPPPDTSESQAADGSSAQNRLKAIHESNSSALQHYNPGPYAGSLLLFLASTPESFDLFYKYDATAGWQDLCHGPVHVIRLPGTHLSIFDAQHTQTIAGKLQPFLLRQRKDSPLSPQP